MSVSRDTASRLNIIRERDCDYAVYILIEKAEAGISPSRPSLLQATPAQGFIQSCQIHSQTLHSCRKPIWQLCAVLSQPVKFFLCMGIPYSSSTFQLRSDTCFIRHLPHAWMFGFNVSPDKIQGIVCTAGDPVYTDAPGLATGDINRRYLAQVTVSRT